MKKIEYCIWAPDFVKSSAGIRCMYILCDLLNSKGYESHVTFSCKTNSELNAPLMSLRKAKKLAKKGKLIIVYPETVPGNPLEAKYVVRWVLNIPGLLGGSRVFNPTEKIFYYTEAFRPHISNDVDGHLYLPTIDESIFYTDENQTDERKLEAFYVGKSKFQPGYFDKEKTLEITREFPNKESLGPIFRACSVFYCFDNSSVIAYEAAMCGCPTVIIPDGTQSREDYELLELGMNGLAWGPEELERARESLPVLQEKHKEVKLSFEKAFSNFIEITQDWNEEKLQEFQRNQAIDEIKKRDQALAELQKIYLNKVFEMAKDLQANYSKLVILIYILAKKFKNLALLKKIIPSNEAIK